jgi:hypothetical protein
MCLSVYLGCHDRLRPGEVPEGSLGIETAKWCPPPLAQFPFVYYLGRKGQGDSLECTCLLAQHVDWDDRGPTIRFDELYSNDGPCPFAALKNYVKRALESGKQVLVVCDDSGGVEQVCENGAYDNFIISTEMISPEFYIFADPVAVFPWRALYVAVPEKS